MTDDKLHEMFIAQCLFQQSMDHDFMIMAPAEQVEYVKMNVLAIQDELMEAMAECRWKPWAKGDKMIVDEDKFGGELIDVLHFLINMFLVINWDGDKVFTAFMAKQMVNRRRQEQGYDGVTSKCAFVACRRALDEPGKRVMYTRMGHEDLAWCNDGCYDAWAEMQRPIEKCSHELAGKECP